MEEDGEQCERGENRSKKRSGEQGGGGAWSKRGVGCKRRDQRVSRRVVSKSGEQGGRGAWSKRGSKVQEFKAGRKKRSGEQE